jgi:N-acetylglucosaminyldiphosphoundecaprenol N-acetyl-beta-D-mannosaminyltransferase
MIEQKGTRTQKDPAKNLIPRPAGKLFGIPVWGLRLDEYVELARKLVKARRKVLFTTIGAPSIACVRKSPEFFNHFQQADVVLLDGILPTWLARSLKYEVPERVPGPDFVNLFLPVAEKQKFRIFFMGSTMKTLDKLRQNCLRKYPELNIVGTLAPPFGELSTKTNYHLINAVNRKKPDVLFVGMSAPRQELWLSRNFERLNVHLAMGVGAAFDYLAGNKSRAPQWLGHLGLEWMYRLVNEPGRLWRRNIIYNIDLLWMLAKNYMSGVSIKQSDSLLDENIHPYTK